MGNILAVVAAVLILGIPVLILVMVVRALSGKKTEPSVQAKARIALYEGRGDLNIVGESKYQGTLRAVDGGRLEQGVTVVFTALVIPEPENPYDKNAITVHADGFGRIGYFCREDAVRYRGMAQELLSRNAVGVCEAQLTGGWDDDASIGVKLGVGGPQGVVKALRSPSPAP